jgi:hypothetical protein
MRILGSAAIVRSSDREAAVRRFTAMFGAPPINEFPIEARGLNVSVFPGVSVLSGPAMALAELADLRATVFVDSLVDAEAELHREGWTTAGELGGAASLLARDPDGNLLEFVETPGEEL